MPARDARQLDNLRQWRNRPEKDLSLASPLAEVARDIKRRARSFGSLGAAWQQLTPPDLVERTSLVSLARGILTVRCDDAACKFELDRWLRSGGEVAVIKRAATTLNRVKLVL